MNAKKILSQTKDILEKKYPYFLLLCDQFFQDTRKAHLDIRGCFKEFSWYTQKFSVDMERGWRHWNRLFNSPEGLRLQCVTQTQPVKSQLALQYVKYLQLKWKITFFFFLKKIWQAFLFACPLFSEQFIPLGPDYNGLHMWLQFWVIWKRGQCSIQTIVISKISQKNVHCIHAV